MFYYVLSNFTELYLIKFLHFHFPGKKKEFKWTNISLEAIV